MCMPMCCIIGCIIGCICIPHGMCIIGAGCPMYCIAGAAIQTTLPCGAVIAIGGGCAKAMGDIGTIGAIGAIGAGAVIGATAGWVAIGTKASEEASTAGCTGELAMAAGGGEKIDIVGCECGWNCG
mmetsp:Transcript_2852/g.8083  ORF Transcript_2852/g.8083 Transcript_2852/m.8083 type:complete len:126 (-) Transcript_2852:1944-2321(-)